MTLHFPIKQLDVLNEATEVGHVVLFILLHIIIILHCHSSFLSRSAYPNPPQPHISSTL